MALLNKLFPAKKKQNIKHSNANISCKPFPFSKDQVRVLLYRECDWRGRKLLFDSTAVNKVPLSETLTSKTKQNFVEVLDGFGYKFLRRNADTLSIGEMIFGAVAMSYRGTSLKVHWLSSPARLLCTQVFMSPLRTRTLQSCSSSNGTRLESISDQSADMSCYSSWESSLNYAGDTLERTLITSTLDGHSDTFTTNSTIAESSGDSGYNASSPRSSGNITSRSSLTQSDYSFNTYSSVSSRNSSQRRIIRNISTSFENDLSSRRSSELFPNKSVDGRRAKLGLAVCVTLTDSVESEMQYYYMEHIPLIESMLNRLQSIVKQAYIEKSQFLSTMIRGCEQAAQWIYDLFRGPRIAEPIWLSLARDQLNCDSARCETQQSSEQRATARNFVDRLCRLLNMFDTKGTNFFISTLVTAILTHHLGWVTTISPDKIYRRQEITSYMNMEELSKNYPYNALWAQLSDLYGANGYPVKLSKTIVCGSNESTINEIINILTYFIRCGEVQRLFTEPILENDLLDSIMNNWNEATNISSFHNKHLSTNFGNLTNCDKLGTSIKKLDLGLCEPHAGLGNKDNLFNLRIFSTLHDQTCQYINLKNKEVNIENLVEDSIMDLTDPSKNSSNTVLYRLKSNEDEGLSTNLENNVAESKCEQISIHGDVVGDLQKPTTDIMINKTMHLSNLRKKNKESYPNLSALITKNSLGYGSSMVVEGSMESLNEKLEVYFVLGENEELTGLHKNKSSCDEKDNKIIPQVDKEFVLRNSLSEENQFKNQINIDVGATNINISTSSENISESVFDVCNAETSTPVPDSSVFISENESDFSNASCIKTENEDVNLSSNESSDVKVSSNNIATKLVKKILQLPLPKSRNINHNKHELLNPGFTSSLFGGVTDHYIPDLVLQGTTANPESFEPSLRCDLALSTHNRALLDEDISESICIVADVDKCEVQVVSSHTYAFANGIAGNVTAMSQLVADMLEAVLQMWRLKTEAEHCIIYIENKLRDMYLKSEALAEMLLSTDFCELSWLTHSLGVEAADVPLLMSIASTHSPQVTRKYGLSFR